MRVHPVIRHIKCHNATRGGASDVASPQAQKVELPRTADGKVDVGEFGTGDFDKLQAKIMEVSGVKSTRFISDWHPGTGYAVKVDDQIIGIGVDSPEQASYAEL